MAQSRRKARGTTKKTPSTRKTRPRDNHPKPSTETNAASDDLSVLIEGVVNAAAAFAKHVRTVCEQIPSGDFVSGDERPGIDSTWDALCRAANHATSCLMLGESHPNPSSLNGCCIDVDRFRSESKVVLDMLRSLIIPSGFESRRSLARLSDGTMSQRQLKAMFPLLHKPEHAGHRIVVRKEAIEKIDRIANELRVSEETTPSALVLDACCALLLLTNDAWRPEKVGAPMVLARKRASAAIERLPKTTDRAVAEAIARLDMVAQSGCIPGMRLGSLDGIEPRFLEDQQVMIWWYVELKTQERMETSATKRGSSSQLESTNGGKGANGVLVSGVGEPTDWIGSGDLHSKHGLKPDMLRKAHRRGVLQHAMKIGRELHYSRSAVAARWPGQFSTFQADTGGNERK